VRMYLREIAAPARLPGPGSQARPRHRPIVGYLGPKKTLLVVDDQPIQRQMLAGMLLPLGFALREAASGHECLESVQAQCPDAVLLDISMDDLDGWRTSRMIREAGFKDVPIIMVSANVFENRPENLAAAQCQAFVAKPVMESELLDTLGLHLNLEWVVQQALPAPTLHAPAAPPVATGTDAAGALPDHLVAEVNRLARMGHIQGLSQALQRMNTEHPEHRAQLKPLMARVDDFDLEGLLAQLASQGPACEDA
jgi:CheY-like chemotaxis protein